MSFVNHIDFLENNTCTVTELLFVLLLNSSEVTISIPYFGLGT